MFSGSIYVSYRGLDKLVHDGNEKGIKDTFNRTAGMWSAYLDIKISPLDVAKMMMLFKISQATGINHPELYNDIAGYAQCAKYLIDGMDNT